jgi:hypothetical protein
VRQHRQRGALNDFLDFENVQPKPLPAVQFEHQDFQAVVPSELGTLVNTGQYAAHRSFSR